LRATASDRESWGYKILPQHKRPAGARLYDYIRFNYGCQPDLEVFPAISCLLNQPIYHPTPESMMPSEIGLKS